MSAKNLLCNPWLGNLCDFAQRLSMMVLDWISPLKVFGGIGTNVFFFMWVFCPLSTTNRSRSLMACYRANEEIKKRKYDQRIREVEHASFSPLIFSTSGGFGPISSLFIKRLSHLHAEKFQRPYSIVVNYIRCRYSFSILKLALRCLRGSCSKPHHIDSVDFCRVISDARLGSFWQLFLVLVFLCL